MKTSRNPVTAKATGKAPAKTPAKTPAKPAKTPDAKAAKPEKIGIKELRQLIASSMPLVAHSTVEQVVSATFEAVAGSLKDGKVVAIKDFGKFEVRHREARVARNPRTGESVEVEAKTVPKFSFSKALKTSLV